MIVVVVYCMCHTVPYYTYTVPVPMCYTYVVCSSQGCTGATALSHTQTQVQ